MKTTFNTFRTLAIYVLSASLLSACARKDNTATVAPPIRVTVLTVSAASLAGSQIYSGTVQSSETTSVSFAVAGTISGLTAVEGQKVTKGQLLGKLQSGDYTNANNIAQAQLAEAQDAYNRLKKLHEANALPEIKWVEVQQKLKQAQNAAEIASRTLKDANLYAPISGVISKKLADVGQTIVPVEPIYEIVSINTLTIDISVPEGDINKFSVGQTASVRFDNSEVEPMVGRISQKAIVADPLTRAYTVKVAIPTTGGQILPGMIGSVEFSSSPKTDSSGTIESILLPSQAVLLAEDNRTFVWIVEKGKAKRRFVKSDELAANGVLIKEGLTPGDSVIVEGMQKVGSGTPVIPLVK